MVWLGRDIKDDLVPTLLSWAGRLHTGPCHPRLCPAWPSMSSLALGQNLGMYNADCGEINVPIHIWVREEKQRKLFWDILRLLQNNLKEKAIVQFLFQLYSSVVCSCLQTVPVAQDRPVLSLKPKCGAVGCFPCTDLTGSWPDMCHFQSFQHWLIKDTRKKKACFCLARLRTWCRKGWQCSHLLLSEIWCLVPS